MTSSLVGSEMCIRDSMHQVHAGQDRHTWNSKLFAARSTRVLACLLYTSDAADDMQCVEPTICSV
eukprot:4087783-Prorocentrum_lima.AAC.1